MMKTWAERVVFYGITLVVSCGIVAMIVAARDEIRGVEAALVASEQRSRDMAAAWQQVRAAKVCIVKRRRVHLRAERQRPGRGDTVMGRLGEQRDDLRQLVRARRQLVAAQQREVDALLVMGRKD